VSTTAFLARLINKSANMYSRW